MKLKELLRVLPLCHTDADLDMDIKKIAQDSREVTPGTLFICIDGEIVDGHKFAQVAEQNGASVILAEKPVDVSI
ncbi:UDP-N-acetylmuramoylalanyl-D-glutamate--2,6-diaminopimelate ligase [Listeria fleischmannii subsp. coloradonensis]|nr:Mur ligase domain-containing protein [Listeria fleischmannii]EIA20301.1 UDP-N-acetylmuramoylalanyl-D-glutamate--2,6-diaminopimelate ligase [Listeria fleischmannii subsp. coloradonensis]